jgi:hypothetical protein
MSHPFTEIAGAVAVVVAVGAGTALMLPRAKPEPPARMIVLDIETPPAVRVEPLGMKSDAERVDDLRRRLGEIAAEQRALASDLRAAVKARRDRGRKTR